MKFTANLFLILLFLPVFVLCLLSAGIKYQLFKPAFWITSLNTHNVYPKLATVLKEEADLQIVNGGGSKNEAKVLTGLITTENIKDFTEKNLINILGYANGDKKELNIYLPVNKIPKGLIPVSLGSITEETSLATLLKEFNIKNIDASQFSMLSALGKNTNYLFNGSLLLIVLFSALMFLLVEPGGRFINLGITYVLAGAVSFGVTQLGIQTQLNLIKNLSQKPDVFQTLSGIILPPVIQDLTVYGEAIALIFIVLGVLFFFFKKPQFNKPQAVK